MDAKQLRETIEDEKQLEVFLRGVERMQEAR